jgi:hypothetical protein
MHISGKYHKKIDDVKCRVVRNFLGNKISAWVPLKKNDVMEL